MIDLPSLFWPFMIHVLFLMWYTSWFQWLSPGVLFGCYLFRFISYFLSSSPLPPPIGSSLCFFIEINRKFCAFLSTKPARTLVIQGVFFCPRPKWGVSRGNAMIRKRSFYFYLVKSSEFEVVYSSSSQSLKTPLLDVETAERNSFFCNLFGVKKIYAHLFYF